MNDKTISLGQGARWLGLSVVFFLSACQQPAAPDSATTTAEPATDTAAAPAKSEFPVHCFESRMPDGSVFTLHITEYYETIVGILDYTFAEKDGAHGTFTGTKEGDLITATWNYTVEGSEQAEEIVIKVSADQAMKASGELMEAEDGVLRLKDPTKVNWDETFTRVQCD